MRRLLPAAILAICLAVFPIETRAELFRVALSTKDFGYLPLFVGMRSGYFAQEGLEIQWIVVNSSVVGSALLAGEIDVAPPDLERPRKSPRAWSYKVTAWIRKKMSHS